MYTWDNLTGSWRSRAFRIQLYDTQGMVGGMGDQGRLTRESAVVNLPFSVPQGTQVSTRDTTYGYDGWGNRTTVTTYNGAGTAKAVAVVNGVTPAGWEVYAAGGGSSARTTTTAYDSTFRAFAVSATNPLGHVEQADYDYRMGTLIKVVGPNSSGGTTTNCQLASYSIPASEEVTCAQYDGFGRMTRLVKPGDSTSFATTSLSYYDTNQPMAILVSLLEIAGQGGVRPISRFYDGWGQLIQTKAESAEGSQQIITDTRYNGLGQAVAQSQPRAVDQTGNAFWGYTDPGSGALYRATTTSYDGLGRVLDVTPPDPGVLATRTRYWIGSRGLATGVYDANDHLVAREADRCQ